MRWVEVALTTGVEKTEDKEKNKKRVRPSSSLYVIGILGGLEEKFGDLQGGEWNQAVDLLYADLRAFSHSGSPVMI